MQGSSTVYTLAKGCPVNQRVLIRGVPLYTLALGCPVNQGLLISRVS